METGTQVKIDGGNYSAINTQDGYFTILDVPLMGEVEKGEKGAPEKVGREWHEKAVANALDRHKNDRYTPPAHIGHNDPIHKAEFAGFVLPKRVGTMKVNGKDQSVIFGDVKLKADAFSKAQKAEIPYISVEVADFNEARISSVSFLDTKPPYFEFPLFTIGNVVTDASAKFEAKADPKSKFTLEEPERPDAGGKAETKCCGHCNEHGGSIAKLAKAMGITVGGAMMEDSTKPTAKPVELADAKPVAGVDAKEDPKMAAKLSMIEDKMVKMEKEREAELADRKAKLMEAEALEDLKGFAIGDSTKKQIAKFAKLGESDLKEFVASVKEMAPKYPPRTLEEYQASGFEKADPVLAKFQAQGPDVLEKASRALAEYNLLKKKIKSYSLSAEQHIEMTLKNQTKEVD